MDKLLILELYHEALRRHYYCEEDGWFSCPKCPEGCLDGQATGCTCGADEHNAKIEVIRSKLGL
jgi:hypothetical protein